MTPTVVGLAVAVITIHPMHEDEVLAAKTKEAALATGVVVCGP
jgi:hypothetical protein